MKNSMEVKCEACCNKYLEILKPVLMGMVSDLRKDNCDIEDIYIDTTGKEYGFTLYQYTVVNDVLTTTRKKIAQTFQQPPLAQKDHYFQTDQSYFTILLDQ